MPLILLYCFAVPFLIAATPIGILRLFDRFNLLGWQMLSSPVIRFVGAIGAWATGGGLDAFILIWMFSGVFDGAVLWWLGWRELKRRDLAPSLLGRPAAAAPRAWFDYMIKSNLSSIFEMARGGLPILIVGGVLGSAASGFLQLATNMTNLVAHSANMLSNATLPDLTKIAMTDGRRPMLRVAYRTMLISLGASLPFVALFIAFRTAGVTLVGGAEFAPAATVLALMAATQLPRIASIVIEAASLSLGYVGASLAAQGASAAVQLALLFLLLERFGVAAAPATMIVGFVIMIAIHHIRLRAA
jgi:O-antigen/teichoic acid export membrane protein